MPMADTAVDVGDRWTQDAQWLYEKLGFSSPRTGMFRWPTGFVMP